MFFFFSLSRYIVTCSAGLICLLYKLLTRTIGSPLVRSSRSYLCILLYFSDIFFFVCFIHLPSRAGRGPPAVMLAYAGKPPDAERGMARLVELCIFYFFTENRRRI